MARPGASRAILVGGLIAGTLDITYAFVFYYAWRGTTPVRILQSVASGALGARAFSDGWKTASLGAFFHFLIAISAAAVFYVASRKITFLINHAIASGILFGVCVYVFMNYLVLPLSRIPFKPSTALIVIIGGLLIHMFGIGLPIALAVKKYS